MKFMRKFQIRLLSSILLVGVWACEGNEMGRENRIERFKNRKSTQPQRPFSDSVVTMPATTTQGPFLKNEGPKPDTSKSQAVQNPEREKLSSPQQKNKKP